MITLLMINRHLFIIKTRFFNKLTACLLPNHRFYYITPGNNRVDT